MSYEQAMNLRQDLEYLIERYERAKGEHKVFLRGKINEVIGRLRTAGY